jgi:bifunctional DNA-binding transcriptional regulator/antitoxin component of YhaV-PrlF toxin-antitoxin module
MIMKFLMISKGGQISVPADVRKRWRTRRLQLEDRGDELVLRPAPDDPVAAAEGVLRGRLSRTSEEMRTRGRDEEAVIEARRWGPF